MPSSRLYPEPINTVLKYTFFTLCYLGRLWVFSKLQPREALDIKHWTPHTYNKYKRAIVDFFDIEYRNRFKGSRFDTFKTLDEMMLFGDRVDKYEHLHRIRWKRMEDEMAYNQAKTLGFWPILIQHMRAE